MRIIFLGSSPIGPQILKDLMDAKFDVVAAVTEVQTGKKMPEVKELCARLKIPCLQFKKVCSEGLDELKKLRPDIFVVASYGQLLTQDFLDIAPTLNVHPSLLPLYRGATPVQAAILNGETKSGVSIQRMVKKLDAGDIIVQSEFDIGACETAGEVYTRAAKIASVSLIEALRQIKDGTAVYTPQNDSKATFCKTIKKEQAAIDFQTSSEQIVNFVRGYNPWPVACCYYHGKLVKVFKAQTAIAFNMAPRQILVSGTKLTVGCGNGEAIELLEVQAEGGKRMSAAAFLCGNKLEGFFDERN